MSDRDTRVVEMRFDNAQFEKGVKESIKTLDELERSLKLDAAVNSLSKLEKEFNSFSASGFTKGIKDAANELSSFAIGSKRLIENVVDDSYRMVKKVASTFDEALTKPMRTGFAEYETQINAVQTILSNTRSKGTTIDQVNEALDTLNTYADKTIYNFTEMTRNIGTFTAAGVGLEDSVAAIKGISNLAAMSGSNPQKAANAMYQMSQALATGTMKLMDWNSVVNAGMGGEIFQESLKETARVHNIAVDDMIAKQGSFRESLSEGWLTSSILTETLQKFTGDLTEEQLRSIGYTEQQIQEIQKLGNDANDAATKVKTLTMLGDTVREELQSGWTQSWEIVIGDFIEARDFWSGISHIITGFIGETSAARNAFLENVFGDPKISYEQWMDFVNAGLVTESLKNALIAEAKKNGVKIDELLSAYASEGDNAFEAVLKDNPWLTQDMFENVLNSESLQTGSRNLEEIQRVISEIENGNWGNGQARFDALTEAGYNWQAMQELVDQDLLRGGIDWSNLTEEQIKNLGVVGELTESYGDFSEIKSEFDKIKQMSGRDLLVGGITNIVQTAADALRLFGEVWNEVFPSDGGFIRDILESFFEFSEGLDIFTREIDETTKEEKITGLTDFGEKIKSIFTGVANSVGLVTDFVSAIWGAVSSFFKGVFDLFGLGNIDMLQVLADFTGFFTTVREGIKDGTIMTTMVAKVTGLMGKLGSVTTKVTGFISDLFSKKGLAKAFSDNFGKSISDALSGLSFDSFKDVIGKIRKFFEEKGVSFEWLDGVSEKLKSFDLIGLLKDAFFGGGLANSLNELFGGIDFGSGIKQAWDDFTSWISGLSIVNDPVGTLSQSWNDFVSWFEGLGITFDPQEVVQTAWSTFTEWLGSLEVDFDPAGALAQGWDAFKHWFEGLGLVFDPINVLQIAWDDFCKFIDGQSITFDPSGIAAKAWEDFKLWFEGLGLTFDPNSTLEHAKQKFHTWANNIKIPISIDTISSSWETFKSWFEGLLLVFDPSGNLSSALSGISGFIENIKSVIPTEENNPIRVAWDAFNGWFSGLTLNFDPQGSLESVVGEVQAWLDMLFPGLSELSVVQAWDEFVKWFGGLGDSLKFDENGLLSQAWTDFADWVSGLKLDTSILSNASGVFSGLSGSIQSFIDTIFGVKTAYAAESEYISSDIGEVSDATGGLTEAVESANGLFEGGNDVFSKISEAVTGAFQAITSESAIETGLELLEKIPIALRDIAIAYAIYQVGTLFRNIGTSITTLADNLGKTVTNIGNSLVGDITNNGQVKQIEAENAAELTKAKADAFMETVLSIAAAIAILVGAIYVASQIPNPEDAFIPIVTAIAAIIAALVAAKWFTTGADPKKTVIFDGKTFLMIAAAIAAVILIVEHINDAGLTVENTAQAGLIVTGIAFVLGAAVGIASIGGASANTAGAFIGLVIAVRQALDLIKEIQASGLKLEDISEGIEVVKEIGILLSTGVAIATAGESLTSIATGVASLFGKDGLFKNKDRKTAAQTVTGTIDMAATFAAYVNSIKDLVGTAKELTEYMGENSVNEAKMQTAVGMIKSISICFDALAGIMGAAGALGKLGGILGMLAGSFGLGMVADGVVKIISSVETLVTNPSINASSLDKVSGMIISIGVIFSAIEGIGGFVGGLGKGWGIFGEIGASAGSWIVGDALVKIFETIGNLTVFAGQSIANSNVIDKLTTMILAIGGIFSAIELVGGVSGGLGGAGGVFGEIAASGGSWAVGDAIVKIFESVDGIAQYEVDKIEQAKSLIESIGGIFSAIALLGGVSGGVGGAFGVLGPLAAGGSTWLVSQAIDTLVDSLIKLSTVNNDELSQAVTNINNFFDSIDSFQIGEETGEFAVGFIEGVIVGIPEAIGSIGGKIAEWGIGIGQTLLDGMAQFLNGIFEQLGIDFRIPVSSVEIDWDNPDVKGAWDWAYEHGELSEENRELYETTFNIAAKGEVDETAVEQAAEDAQKEIKYILEKKTSNDDGTNEYEIYFTESGLTHTFTLDENGAIYKEYLESGVVVGNGVIEGIQKGLDEGTITADELKNNTEEVINSVFQINSPSKVMIPKGEAIGEGIGVGINQGGSYLITAFTNMVNSSIIFLAQFPPQFQQHGLDVTSNIAWGINIGGGTIASALYNMHSSMLIVLGNLSNGFREAGYNFTQGLAIGIRSGSSLAIDAAAHVATVALTAAKNTLQEKSPSQATRLMGRFFSQGLGLGVRDDEKFAIGSAQHLGNSMIDAMRTTARLVDAVMNDELNMTPTISPIIDVSNLQNANDLMNGAFRSRSVALAYNASMTTDGLVNPFDRLIERLDAKNDFGNTSIYMDGAVLNDDEEMRAVTLDFLYGLKRKAAL